ncbi:MAG: bifunctional phosphopantothenoylcysteine decarboxylase/phosphopantothenate--cysteine ligase CoaBC [Vicingaceae bacterium]
MLSGKKILLGITGSIAAYKSAYLIRHFIKAGAEVKVIATSASFNFITPLTLSTLSKNQVYNDFFQENGEWNNHVELGLWADIFVIAPATANTIAKINAGICDNLLLATYLSCKCPVVVAPAMDLDMFAHPVTQKNIEQLKKNNIDIIEPASGELASGLDGKGRMEEPEVIFEYIKNKLIVSLPLKGKKVLITAGPTYENIDPVRFIGNYSSGKMGFALAKAALDYGADVVLITGPTNLNLTHNNLKTITVKSADEMFNSVMENKEDIDIFIMAAAVADYTVENPSNQKIKKKSDQLSITLKPTKDILKALGECKKDHQILVGFALETNNEIENAKKKLVSKNADYIVLNSMNDKDAAFNSDKNKITILDKNNNLHKFELKDKQIVAFDILNHLLK